MFKKILVPYDYSEQSQRALRHAVELAGTSPGCQVVVFNTLQQIPPSIGMQMALDTQGRNEDVEEFREDAISNLKREASHAIGETSKDIDVKYNVIIGGYPSDRILEVEKQEGADLIVMGSVGRTGIKKFKFGSVSRKVVEASQCPVMIVH